MNEPHLPVLTYRTADCAWFRDRQSSRWELSNMAGGMPLYWPLERKPANRWGSSEQLYQACKYSTAVHCLPKDSPDADPCVRHRIRAHPTPRGAKLTQKCAVRAGLVRADWGGPEEVRIKAMLWVLELKLYWNRFSFGRILASTGSLPIVEISGKDPFWGVVEQPDGSLAGENMLGRLLMQVRERIQDVARGHFTHPEGWLLP